MSTVGQFCVALFWLDYKRSPDDKDQLRRGMVQLLKMCALAADVPSISVKGMSDDWRASCRRGAAEGTSDDERCICCCHLEVALAAVPPCDAPQERCWHELEAMWQFLDCPAVQKMFVVAVVRLAAAVDDNVETWGSFDLSKSEGIVATNSHGRRMRIDPHLKAMVIENAIREGRAATGSQFIKHLKLGDMNLAVRWVDDKLTALQAECHLRFRNPFIVSWAMDAGVIGKPARDFLVAVQWAWPQQCSTVLPPQVPRLSRPSIAAFVQS